MRMVWPRTCTTLCRMSGRGALRRLRLLEPILGKLHASRHGRSNQNFEPPVRFRVSSGAVQHGRNSEEGSMSPLLSTVESGQTQTPGRISKK